MARRAATREPGLERWARFSFRHKKSVIAVWVALLIGLSAISQAFGGSFVTEFSLPGSETQRATDLLNSRFPARAGDTADIVVESVSGVDDPAVQATVEELFAKVKEVPGVVGVESPYESPGLISQDGNIARATVYWSTSASTVDHEHAKEFVNLVQGTNREGLQIEAGGSIPMMVEQPEFGSEILGLLFAIVILFFAFGSIVAAGLPIGAAVFGLGAGFAVIALLARMFSFPDFAPQFAAMIGIGVGIDYSLLVVTRFREGLHRGKSVEDSVALALGTAGRSVVFAGVVVAIAFLGLFAMGIPFIAAMGVTGALVVVVAVIVAVTLMPAILSLVGHRVDSLRVPFLHSTEGVDPKSGWYRWSEQIQKRPLPYFFAAAIVLLVLASPILSMKLGFTDAGNRAEEFPTRRAYDLLSKGFGPGFNGPFLMVVDISEGGEEAVDRAVEAVKSAPGIAFVGEPTLNPEGDTAIIVAIPTTSPQDEATNATVHNLRDNVVPGVIEGTPAKVYVAGAMAAQIDIQDQIEERMPLLFIGVIGLSFVLLMVVFRSILVAAKAAIMNLLSIGASYGVVVAIFQWGWFSSVLGIEPGPIEVFLPMMFFAILFGLSMDYEVFLISRIREEYVVTGKNATAVSHGLAATARVITAAAAIMVAVFLSFVLGDDRIIKMFGIGLATAIFVDATIVRLVLVPATMELLGDANWWLPKWLDRVLPHINVEGHDDSAPTAPNVVPGTAGGQ